MKNDRFLSGKLLLGLFLVIFFMVPQSVTAAELAPEIEWQNFLGGSDADEAYSIQQTSDGGYIVAGFSNSNDGDVSGNHDDEIDWTYGALTYDFWVVKLYANGNMAWQSCLGGSEDDQAYSIQQTSDGGYIVAGKSSSIDGDVTGNHGDSDFWVVKLDTSGNIDWQSCLGGSGTDEAHSIQQTSDGGYIVAGFSNSNDGNVNGNHGDSDFWVVKLYANGNMAWQSCLGGSGPDEAYSIQQTSDGGYIVAGKTLSIDGDVSGNHGGSDFWVVKLYSNGHIDWQSSLGGSGPDEAYSIQQTSDGGYIVAGCSCSNDGNVTGNHVEGEEYWTYDYWVVKLDANGHIDWQSSLGGYSVDIAYSIQETNDGGYIVAGETEGDSGDVTDLLGGIWVVKLDASGNIDWEKCLGDPFSSTTHSIQQTSDGGYIIAGLNHKEDDYWIVKLENSEKSDSSNSEFFIVKDGSENYEVEIIFEEDTGSKDLVQIFEGGLYKPFQIINGHEYDIKEVRVLDLNGNPVTDEVKLKSILRAVSGWVLASYDQEGYNGKSVFERLDEDNDGAFSDMVDDKQEVLGLEHILACPADLLKTNIWEDSLENSVSYSLSQGGNPPGLSDNENEKIDKIVGSITAGLDDDQKEIVNGFSRAVIKSAIVTDDGVKYLKTIQQHYRYSPERDEDVDVAIDIVIDKYDKENDGKRLVVNLREYLMTSIQGVAEEQLKELVKNGIKKIQNYLTEQASEKTAAVFGKVVSGVGMGYAVADELIDGCGVFECAIDQTSSIYILKEYGFAEKSMSEDLIISREIDLQESYSYIALRKMEFSSLSYSYQKLADMTDVSEFTKLLSSTLPKVGLAAEKKDILEASHGWSRMAYDPEYVTDYLYSKTSGRVDYHLDPSVPTVFMFADEQKIIQLELTPYVHYLDAEIFHFNEEGTPIVSVNQLDNSEKSTLLEVNIEVPDDIKPGKYLGLISINTQEKIFSCYLEVNVLPDDQLLVEILGLDDYEKISLEPTKIEVYVSNKGIPTSWAKVTANVEQWSPEGNSLENLDLTEEEAGHYSATIYPSAHSIYNIFVLANKEYIPGIWGFIPGSDSVESLYTYDGNSNKNTLEGIIYPDDNLEHHDQVDFGTEYLEYILDWEGSDLNIHLYDSEGKHTGFDSEGEIEVEIPDSQYSGNVKPEYIILTNPAQIGDVKIVVEAVEVPVGGENYELATNIIYGSSDQDEEEVKNVIETAEADGNFTALLAALNATNLTDTLKGDELFTVFAPTDDAFSALPNETIEALQNDTDMLTQILLYHVADGKLMAADLASLASISTIQGEDIAISVKEDGRMFVEDAEIILTDIEASNGVIHAIDLVLILPEEDEEIPESPSAELPDLMVQSVSRDILSPKMGDTITFEVHVYNEAPVPAGSSTLGFYVDGVEIESEYILGLEAYSGFIQTFSWVADRVGDVQVSFVSHADFEVAEREPPANEKTITFNVGSPDPNSGSDTPENDSSSENSDGSSSSSSSSSKSSSSSGGGGGGGGAGSPEPASNVEVKELSQQFVTNGNHVKFGFPRNVTCITYVDFDPKRSLGKVTTIVEMLKEVSKVASTPPSGMVYRNANIWVGNAGTASPDNIENAVVGFRVEKAWIASNGVDESEIRLCRHSEEKWGELSTRKIREDSNYVYFEAETPGFSPFSITVPSMEGGVTGSAELAAEGEDIVRGISSELSSENNSSVLEASAVEEEYEVEDGDEGAGTSGSMTKILLSFGLLSVMILIGFMVSKKQS